MNASASQINYKTSWLLAEATGRSHVTTVLQEIQQRRGITSKDVLELGSGVGTNLLVLSTDNRVRGVEGLEAAVCEAQSRGIDTLQANLEAELPLEDNSADWILCIDVLEHLLNPAVCLASVHRILRDDGRLIINVPNHFDWHGRIRILSGSGIDSQRYFPDSSHWKYPHVRFFQRATIEAFLAEGDFTVEEDLSNCFITFPKAAALRQLGFSGAMNSLRNRWPDLFSAGFFLVCRKKR